ncbi:growth arrest and DNA damage-inducible protein GADD45 gamma [Triplophysa rosa]|uniref:Growth arrest and DNA damage-inducible protein GADD45 gamma n=1 Tax=Triplophysa rosa TaxID=992332 RepID=A0A9W7TFG0_TRIRA|nr:growth arrest and DNA damage-inducible protein GADD45 gamma [Triplophysa rosa]
MTFEEFSGQDNAAATGDRMQSAGTALEELLVSAKKQDCLTVGVYESAQVMNVDPDSVAFCVLATDEEYECDIALQIHFTLIQAFCFDNDINIVRVHDIERLADIVCGDQADEPKDAHCILVTVSRLFVTIHLHLIYTLDIYCAPDINFASLFISKSPNSDSWKGSALEKLGMFCEESRNVYEWVPTITLPER